MELKICPTIQVTVDGFITTYSIDLLELYRNVDSHALLYHRLGNELYDYILEVFKNSEVHF